MAALGSKRFGMVDNGKEREVTVSGRAGEIEREIEELDRLIEMEMAVYSGVEYIAAKTEKD